MTRADGQGVRPWFSLGIGPNFRGLGDMCNNKVKWLLLVVLAAYFAGSTAHAAPKPMFPPQDLDITNIRNVANQVAKRSSACLTALCVRGSCTAAKKLLQSLAEADAWLTGIQKPLLEWRALDIANGARHLEDAGMAQDRRALVRKAQLWQEGFAAVATGALELASWHSFLTKYSSKTAAWKGFSRKGSTAAQFLEFLKHLHDHLGRIDAVFKYPKIGSVGDPTVTITAVVKTSLEAKKAIDDIRKLVKDKGARHPETREAIGGLAAKVADIALKYERLQRDKRLQEYIRDATNSFSLAKAAIAKAARTNVRWLAARQTSAVIRRAMFGLMACAARICTKALPTIKIPKIAPPDRDPLRKLRYFNRKLKSIRNRLTSEVGRYRLVRDFASSLTTDRREYTQTEEVVARYKLSQCFPKDARFVVHRRLKGDARRLVLSLGKKPRPRGRFSFRVRDDYSGKWRDRSGKVFKITQKGRNITLTWYDKPIRGRNRIYKGTYRNKLSRPGNYQLTVRSKARGQTYLPRRFKIEPPQNKAWDKITLRSKPGDIKDISPKLPKKVREQLIVHPLRTRMSYKAIIRPRLTRSGKLRLAVVFRNYKLKWSAKDNKIDKRTIREKTERKVGLRR